MEYLQYFIDELDQYAREQGFKPYYKWNTFNTL